MYALHIWLHDSENKIFYSAVMQGDNLLHLARSIIVKFSARRFLDHFREAKNITSCWEFPGKKQEEIKKSPLSQLKCDQFEITFREKEVLELAEEGKKSTEIAEYLSISEETVKSHLKHSYEKLDVHGCREAIHKLL